MRSALWMMHDGDSAGVRKHTQADHIDNDFNSIN